MNQFVFKCLKVCSIILFLLSVIVIGIYKFPNRNLTVCIETEEQENRLYYSSTDIKNAEYIAIIIEGTDSVSVSKVKFYGGIRSISLKTLDYSAFATYVDHVQNGEMIWENDCLKFTSEGSICIRLNQNGLELFQSLSKSFLLERICLMEIVLVVCMILFVGFTALEEKYDTSIRNNHGPIYECKRFFSHIKKYGRFMIYAARTDLKAEVANSYLNRLWWLLEPFFNMLVYVIVFGGIMGRSIKNYSTFVFAALLMWNFFSKTVNYSVKLVRNNRDIVTKVYVPKFVLLISNMFLNIFKLLFSFIVLAVMLVIFKVQIGLEILMVVPAYIVLFLLAFGLGMIFLHYGVYVDDLSYAVGILLNMLMFLSGTFYDVTTTLTEPLGTILLCINPVAMVTDSMRNALLYRKIVNVPLLGIWFFISVILCCIGIHIVYKNENGYVKVV